MIIIFNDKCLIEETNINDVFISTKGALFIPRDSVIKLEGTTDHVIQFLLPNVT